MAARPSIFDTFNADCPKEGARLLLGEADQWRRMALTLRDIADRIAPEHTKSVEASRAASAA